MKEYENRTTVFSRLGLDFDLFEGIYASAWDGSCQFLELTRTPVCCGVSMPYGLVYAKEPTAAAAKFIHAALLVRSFGTGTTRPAKTFREG